MKKIAYYMSLCLVMFVGAFAFAGCGNTGEVASLKVDANALAQQGFNTEYTVGDTLDLTNGEFTVVYSNGEEDTLNMINSLGVQVYIDYGDGNTDTNVFTTPSEHQPVVIKYEGKTTTFYVTVNKGIITEQDVNLNSSYTKIYTGQPLPVNELADIELPSGASVEPAQYRQDPGNINDFTTTPPTDAGNYVIRLNINGGTNYEDTHFDIPYTIQKADLASLTTNGILNFPNISISHGESYDLSQNWQFSDIGELGAITEGFDESFAGDLNNLVYSYKASSETEYTILNADTFDEVISTLPTGAYDIRVTGTWANNIEDFAIDAHLVVIIKTLVYGEDYTFNITKQDGTPVEYELPTSAEDINTIIQFGADETIGINITIEWLNGIGDSVVGEPTISFRTGQSWNQIQNSISTPGTYKIWVEVEFESFTYHFDNDSQFNGFQIIVE